MKEGVIEVEEDVFIRIILVVIFVFLGEDIVIVVVVFVLEIGTIVFRSFVVMDLVVEVVIIDV